MFALHVSCAGWACAGVGLRPAGRRVPGAVCGGTVCGGGGMPSGVLRVRVRCRACRVRVCCAGGGMFAVGIGIVEVCLRTGTFAAEILSEV